MKATLFIIVCCIIPFGCYIPQKYSYEEPSEVKVIETHKEGNGFEIIWEDSKGNEHKTFAPDTSVFKIGYTMRTLIKL